CGCEKSAPRWTAAQRLAGADSGILELLGEVQALHGAIRGNALPLRLETQAAVGLFFTRNTDVADGVFRHGDLPRGRRHHEGKNGRQTQGDRGANRPVGTGLCSTKKCTGIWAESRVREQPALPTTSYHGAGCRMT